jgi:hypothetical protein
MERPSTDTNNPPEDQPCPPPPPISTLHPRRPSRDPGAAAREAPIRVLAPDFVPLDPDHRAEAVRALTEMILSWMHRTGRDTEQPSGPDTLDQAA